MVWAQRAVRLCPLPTFADFPGSLNWGGCFSSSCVNSTHGSACLSLSPYKHKYNKTKIEISDGVKNVCISVVEWNNLSESVCSFIYVQLTCRWCLTTDCLWNKSLQNMYYSSDRDERAFQSDGLCIRLKCLVCRPKILIETPFVSL